MQTAIPRVISFEDKAVADFALETKIELITFRNTQTGIQAPRKPGIEHCELSDKGGIGAESPGKVKIRGDEYAALGVAHQLPCGRVDQRVRVKEKLLRAQCEIVNRAQQCARSEEH